MVDVAVRDRVSQQRCPYCHSFVTVQDDAWVCANCGAAHHRDCFSEHGRCSVHGCAQSSGGVRLSTCGPPPRIRWHRWALACVIPPAVGMALLWAFSPRESDYQGGGINTLGAPRVTQPSEMSPNFNAELERARARTASQEKTVEPSTSERVRDRSRHAASEQPISALAQKRLTISGVALVGRGRIAAFSQAGDLDIYEIATGKRVGHAREPDEGEIGRCVALPSKGVALVGRPFDATSPDLTLVNLDSTPIQTLKSLHRRGDGWRVAALDGDWIRPLVVDSKGFIEDWYDGDCTGRIEGGEDITAISAGPSRASQTSAAPSRVAVVGTSDGTLRLCYLHSDRRVERATGRGEILAIRAIYGQMSFRAAYGCIAGATTGEKTSLFRVNFDSGEIDRILEAPFMAHVIAISEDGRRAIAGSAQGDVAIFDLAHDKAQVVPEHVAIETAAFSADGLTIVTGSRGMGPIVVWDAETGAIKQRIRVE